VAVADEAWLAVWWPWLLVWGLTAALLGWAVLIAAGSRKRSNVSHHGIAVYLNPSAVMGLYQSGHANALSRQVEKRVSRSRMFGGSAELAPLRAAAERGVTSEVFEKYVVKDEPISVISIVVDVLEKAHQIVEVDLVDQEVVASDALDHAFRGRPPGEVRLRRINKFLLILGDFRVFDATEDTVTFRASFGDPDDPDDAPQLEIVCAAVGLRPNDADDLPSGRFQCLGRVETWDPRARLLKVRPIAVFL
jgi:hypothetical protein